MAQAGMLGAFGPEVGALILEMGPSGQAGMLEAYGPGCRNKKKGRPFPACPCDEIRWLAYAFFAVLWM